MKIEKMNSHDLIFHKVKLQSLLLPQNTYKNDEREKTKKQKQKLMKKKNAFTLFFSLCT
jgi:hypothetical protein